MPRAFMLINVESGFEDDTLNKLKAIEGTKMHTNPTGL
jgi:hypothetical protein